jgi:hypothetical protein
MSGMGKAKLILGDGWPGCYQECNVFIPYCNDTITGGCCGKLSPGVTGVLNPK